LKPRKNSHLLKELKEIIGAERYAAFLDLLKEIGPHARTHRISVVIAAILHYALSQAAEDADEGTLDTALLTLEEEPYLALEANSEESKLLYNLIDALCKEAHMHNERLTSRKIPYSIAENAITEFCSWYNMPWED
jgi:hypothetical protein